MARLKAGSVAAEGMEQPPAGQPPAGQPGKGQRWLAADWRGAVQPLASLLVSAPSQPGQLATR